MNKTQTTTSKIRDLNDKFRTHGEGRGQILVTSGISNMPEPTTEKILTAVANFVDFTSANDPYDEHDFGSLVIADERIFWKFDYYAPDMLHGSEDPANPAITVRVLSIMLASEY